MITVLDRFKTKDGRYRYGMSSVGKCSRTLSAEMLGLLGGSGATEPEYLRLAAREGTRHEAFIREDIEEFGWQSITKKNGTDLYCEFCDREGYHVEISRPTRLLVGHMDDFNYKLDDPAKIHLGEYKALGKFIYEKVTKKGIEYHRTHATQISCYWEAANHLPIFYVHKSRDTGQMHITIMQEPPYLIDEITERLDVVEASVEKGELAPCDMIADPIDYWSCTALCESANNTIPEHMIPEDIDSAVAKLKTARVLETEIKEMTSESRAMIHAFLDGSGKKSLESHGLKISLVPPGESTSYPVPKEIKDQYKVKKPRVSYIVVRETETTEE